MKAGAALPERRLQAPLLVIPGGLLAEFLRTYGKVSHGIGARFMEGSFRFFACIGAMNQFVLEAMPSDRGRGRKDGSWVAL